MKCSFLSRFGIWVNSSLLAIQSYMDTHWSPGGARGGGASEGRCIHAHSHVDVDAFPLLHRSYRLSFCNFMTHYARYSVIYKSTTSGNRRRVTIGNIR